MIPTVVHALALSAVFVLVACSSGSSRDRGGTPAGIEAGIMYGQSGIDFVIENFTVFRTRTESAMVSPEAVGFLRDLREPVTIKVFLGTWCRDAELHVPVLFKALQRADNSRITVRVIAMDRRKQDRDGLVDQYQIGYTPTFVVEHDGLEIGRVVETPIADAAQDIVAILRNNLGR
jgi:hypothetical protein